MKINRLTAGLLCVVACGVADAAAPPAPPKPLWAGPKDVFGPFALSRDGKLIAYLSAVYEPRPGRPRDPELVTYLLVRRARTGEVVAKAKVTGRPAQSNDGFFALSDDAKTLVCGQRELDRTTLVTVMDVPSGRVRHQFEVPGHLHARGVLLPDGKTLAVSSPRGIVALHDVATGKEVGRLAGDEDGWARENDIDFLRLSADGRRIAVGTKGGWLSVWDVSAKKRLWRERPTEEEVRKLFFSADGEMLFAQASGRRQNLYVYHARNGKRFSTISMYERSWALKGDVQTILPGGDLIVSRESAVGFVRWDPWEEVVRGDAWGFYNRYRTETFGKPTPPWVRSVSSGQDAVIVSADGSVLAFRCGTGGNLVVYDLKALWPKGR